MKEWASDEQIEHPILNIRNFVLLALVQVMVIVFSTLAAGLTNKLLEGKSLPLWTVFYVHCGFLILLIPLAWITAAAWFNLHSKTSEDALAAIFCIGILLLAFLFCSGAYATIAPLVRIDAAWALERNQITSQQIEHCAPLVATSEAPALLSHRPLS
jgi:hypothetical protein